jgi:hypothetical protein
MERIEKSILSGRLTIRETVPKSKPATSPTESFNRRQRRELTRLRGLHDSLSERVALLIQSVESLKEISEAAAALDRLGRITDRLVLMERQVLGLDKPADSLGDDFARLLKTAWERAYGAPPTETLSS